MSTTDEPANCADKQDCDIINVIHMIARQRCHARGSDMALEHSLTVKKFAPSRHLTMCFRILMSCPSPYVACASDDPDDRKPSGDSTVNVAETTNCCFKKDRPELPQSWVWRGMRKDANGSRDLPTTVERPCFRDSSGKCFDDQFYPRRCVRMYVAEPPQIVNVLPADPHMRHPQRMEVVEHSDSWRLNSTAADVRIRPGQILRLNIDAYDPNEEDDVDVLPDAGVDLPSGSALGPRMCCNGKQVCCTPCQPSELDVSSRRALWCMFAVV